MAPFSDGTFGPVQPPGNIPERTPSRLPPGAEGTGPVGLGHLLTREPFDHFEVTDEELDEASHVSTYGEAPDQGWDDFTTAMMRSSCAFFAQEVLQGPPEPPYDGKFMINDHHEEWDDLIAEYRRICVLAPRDHGKTFFFDFAYPIWKVFYGPRSKGFIFSSTKPQAERILMDIIEELESNPKLKWLVPEKKKIWSNSHIQLANGAHIYARGFGTRVRGGHPQWIVVDDGLNDETAYSDVVRKKQNDYFFAAISNMITPGGQIIVVGTPFHQDDLYAHLKKNSEYEFRQCQAVVDKAGEQALWPERYSWDLLMAKQREIGSIKFQREFQCVPIADEMSLFPSYLFIGEPVEQFTLKLGMPLEYWTKHVGITGVYTGVDFAMSASVRADYTVIWTMGVDKYGNRWLMDIVRGHGLPYQQQLSLINSVGRRYKPGLIYCEANQAQRIFGDELIRTTDLPIKLFITGAAKNTLDKGVPSLRVLFENRKLRIPRGDERSVVLTDMWIEEMHNITFLDGKVQSVAGHDDMAMACWLCDQACRMGGFSFTFGDEEEYAPDELRKLTLDQLIGVDGTDDEGDGEGDGNGNGDTEGIGQVLGNLYEDALYEDEPNHDTSLYDETFIIQPISAF